MAETTQVEGASAGGQLAVRIVTPGRILIDTTVDAVEIPASTGYFEALYGAAPLLAELGAGEVKLHGGTSGDAKFFVSWGFVEVLPERVTVLAETALKPEEIDAATAQKELEQGQKDWAEAGDDAVKYDYATAEIHAAEEKIAASKDR